MAKLPINNFNGGEVSPYLYARDDVDGIYNKSCLKMENFVPLPYGGATKRPGTKFLGQSYSGKIRLIPFTFSVTDNYLLEFGNLYVRVWKNDSPHTSGGSDIILTSPYTVADLDDIQFTQSADILFLAHKNHEPQEIKRFSDTNWSMSEVEWSFPPMLNENTDQSIKVTTSQKSGETVLTASQDLFNANMVGGYFSFEVDRLSNNISLEREFTASGISDPINVSNTDWDFETGGIWAGRVTIERSLDGGVSYSTYITVCDTSSIDSNAESKNFAISSPSKEGNNTFLRVQYEKGPNNIGDCQVSLIPTSTTVNSLVRITSYNNPTSVVATIISDFQDAISEYTTEWSVDTAYAEGDRVKVSSGLDFAAVNVDLSGFTGILSSVDTFGGTGASSGRVPGTYDFVDGVTTGISNAGSGSGARIRVVVATDTSATVSVLGKSGYGYVGNDTFTIQGSALGGGANITFDVGFAGDTTAGLDHMRGGAYGDNKYFAIDKDRKVFVFTKNSGNVFTPYDQWTASSNDSVDNDGYDIAYYADHVYVIGGYSARTRSGFMDGTVSGFYGYKVFKYDLDGSNGTLAFSNNVTNWASPNAGQGLYQQDQVMIPYGIGVLNDKFYVSYQRVGIRNRGMPHYTAYLNQVILMRINATTMQSEQAHYFYNISQTKHGSAIPYTPTAGTPIVTDITGISDISVNKIYCTDRANNKIIFFTPDFVGAGEFTTAPQFPSTTITAAFYDNSVDQSEVFWVGDTTGNIKKYDFVTAALFYQCLLPVSASDGDSLSQQISDGHWYEVSPEMTRFTEGAFSNHRGFPDTLAFYENRLVYAGSTNNPNTLWLSETDNFFNFKTSTLDTSPMKLTIASGQLDGIQWLVPHKQLIIGTSGSEWALGAESDNKPVTPTSFDIKRKTTYGSNSIAGLLVNSAVLFVMRQGKKLREWIFNYDSQDYVAPDLTLVAEHISGAGFKAIALQQQPDNIVWTINSDNQLVGMTYERDQKVVGWHRHKCTGGFESVTVLPTASDADAVYVSIKKTVPVARIDSDENEDGDYNYDNEEVRYVCRLDNREWGTNHLTQYNGLDYYSVLTNVSTGTVSGLGYPIISDLIAIADGTTQFAVNIEGDGDLNIGDATHITIASAEIGSEANKLVLTFNSAHGLAIGDTITVSELGFTNTDPNGKYFLESGNIPSATSIKVDLTGSTETFSTSPLSKITVYKLNNTTYSRIVVGNKYTATLAPLYFNYISRSGQTGGSKLNASMATLRFKDTVSAKCGQTEATADLQPVKFAGTGMVSETAEVYLSNAPEYLQTVYVVADEPSPCTILSMMPRVDTGGIR